MDRKQSGLPTAKVGHGISAPLLNKQRITSPLNQFPLWWAVLSLCHGNTECSVQSCPPRPLCFTGNSDENVLLLMRVQADTRAQAQA